VELEPPANLSEMGAGRIFSHRFVYFFVVDTCVLQCYKPHKDKLFGGESPNELYKQSRVRPQTCLAGQAC